jgi:hypothetical protein
MWVRHAVSEMFPNPMKPFSNDEIIKECLKAAADVPFPVKNTSVVYLLYHDLALEEQKISHNTEETLKSKLSISTTDVPDKEICRVRS